SLDMQRFFSEERGRVVTAFLENFFKQYVEYDFTADLETQLDTIAEGQLNWQKMLDAFWKAFSKKTKETLELRTLEVLEALNQDLEAYLFPKREDGKPSRECPVCAKGTLSLKPGKFGFFIGCSDYPECKYTRQLSQDNGDNPDADAILNEPKELGLDPKTGGTITLRKGPYGPYVQLDLPADQLPPPPPPEIGKNGKPKKQKKVAAPKPKRASLPKGLTIEAVTLEKALELLALPRLVGKHPETGDKIEANNGRFGPYLKYQDMFVSIPKGDDLFTIGMNRAVDLIAQKKEKIANGTLKTFKRKPKAAKEAKPPKKAAKKTAAKTKKKTDK